MSLATTLSDCHARLRRARNDFVKKMSLLVVGSVALDSIKTPFGKREDVLGGSATYLALAASYFTPVNLVSVVGHDFPGSYLEFFRKRNINLEGLTISKNNRTFRWQGYYEDDLNEAHTIRTELNVFENFKPEIPKEYQSCDYLFLANVDPDIQSEVLHQVKGVKFVVCDTIGYWIDKKPESLKKVLAKVDAFMVNESELREFTHESNLLKGAKKVMELGPGIVVVKRGDSGATMFMTNSIFSLPAYPLEAVLDPTGAGDSFGGGFIGYICQEDSTEEKILRKAMVYGSAIASFSVGGFGTEGLKDLEFERIEKRHHEFEELTDF